MFLSVISFFWGLIPTKLALSIWRLLPASDLPSISTATPNFPLIKKDFQWSQKEALEYFNYKKSHPSVSIDDEKLIRTIEIRKRGFFKSVSCSPASIIATTLAQVGQQSGDLRLTNTALKLRDITATSLPPIFSSDRAFFNAADRTLESTLKKLEQP